MRTRCLSVLLLLLAAPSIASAEVAKVSIASRTMVADGQPFGRVGPYEKLTGTIEFAVDPNEPHNRRIVDIAHAPRAADGRVHFTSDLYILRPVDAAKGNGVLLFEVANRGNKLLFGYFNGIRGANDPTAMHDFGDGFLMREGYTVVWVGWQFDVAPPRLHVEAPPVDMQASPTPDVARISFIPDRPSTETSPGDLPAYAPKDAADAGATLTVRDKFWDRPQPLPRASWRIQATSARPTIVLDSGFEPGRVYELTYRARGAVVAGVGLAALRDAASAFLHRSDLPVAGRSAYLFGASQSGRLVRQFLLDGFNVDEQNRRVFSVAWAHIAGAGLGSFNERFAMPGYSSFPATKAPYTFPELLAKYSADQAPKVIATNTDVEYWGQGRAAALTHISVDGTHDLSIPANVRIYLLAGTQHGEAPFPPVGGNGQQLPNPTPQVAVMHALMRAAYAWDTMGTAPPASQYPRLSDRTAVRVSAVEFPRIPGVADPTTIEGPARADGSRVVQLPFLVPRVDADGNDVVGIRVPDQSVPLATVTGWNFRSPKVGNPTTIYALLGSYIPFGATKAERDASHDPRPSVEERYGTKDEYLRKIRTAADALIGARYLLAEDTDAVMARANAHWELAAHRAAH